MTKEERDIKVEEIRLDILRKVKKEARWQSIWCDVKVTKEAVFKKNLPIESRLFFVRSNLLIFILVALLWLFAATLYCFIPNFIVLYQFGVFALAGSVLLIYQNREIPKSIFIDKQVILLGDLSIEWKNIFQTYIVKEPYGKSTKTYLWIALNNGEYEKVNVSNFAYKHLGHSIEQYKRIYLSDDNTDE